LASSLVKVKNGQAITSTLSTKETDVVIEVPEVRRKGYRAPEEKYCHNHIGSLTVTERGVKYRTQEVLEALKIGNLNPEERRVMEETCRDYQDIFYLPGDRLSCTTTVKH
jgi:hypothetical protein